MCRIRKHPRTHKTTENYPWKVSASASLLQLMLHINDFVCTIRLLSVEMSLSFPNLPMMSIDVQYNRHHHIPGLAALFQLQLLLSQTFLHKLQVQELGRNLGHASRGSLEIRRSILSKTVMLIIAYPYNCPSLISIFHPLFCIFHVPLDPIFELPPTAQLSRLLDLWSIDRWISKI